MANTATLKSNLKDINVKLVLGFSGCVYLKQMDFGVLLVFGHGQLRPVN